MTSSNGSWGGAALSYARCRPPVNGFLRDRSSIPDYFPSTNVTGPGATRIIGDAVTQPASQLALTELGDELVRGLPIDELVGVAVAPHLMPGLVSAFRTGIFACRGGPAGGQAAPALSRARRSRTLAQRRNT